MKKTRPPSMGGCCGRRERASARCSTRRGLRLGAAVRRQAEATRPAAPAAALVTNGNDTAIDNGLAKRMADLWTARGMAVTRYEFAKTDGLGHELVDPMEPGADPRLTYPVLVAMIEGREPINVG